jgi:translocation and assembly module TamA
MDRAQALELFGRCIFGECKESQAEQDSQNFIDPKRYQVDLQVQQAGDEDLEDAVQSASELYRGKDSAVGGTAGIIARAKGDYQRILAGLYNEGHYGGSISIQINGREASELAPGTEIADNPLIEVNVDPGPQYRFGTAEVQNSAPPPTDEDDRLPSLADVGFASGLTANADAVGRASKLSRDAWREQGFAKAKIVDRQARAIHPDSELNVTMRVEPGRRATYGTVNVEGTERMDRAFVARQTGLLPGQEFNPDDLERARVRLERLGVFSVQKIEEGERINEAGELPMNVIVQERKLRRIGVGATVSSVDGIGAETFWLHRNLFGKAERLRLDASVGGIGETLNFRKFNYSLGATFVKPGTFTPDTDLSVNLNAKREVTDTLTESSAGGSVKLTHYQSPRLTFGAGLFAEFGQYTGGFGRREFTTAGLLGEATYDSRDNSLDATRGFYVDAEIKPFYEFQFSNIGVRAEVEGRAYRGFSEDGRFVLASRAKIGSVIGPARNQTPDNLLFFSGGGSSVRGYDFESIGVTEANGAITGGSSVLEGSVEARFKFTENWGAVAFVDAGTVSAKAFPNFNDIRIGAGAGIRYYTGLGAIRLDVAAPLNPLPTSSPFAIYAGIGQAF